MVDNQYQLVWLESWLSGTELAVRFLHGQLAVSDERLALLTVVEMLDGKWRLNADLLIVTPNLVR